MSDSDFIMWNKDGNWLTAPYNDGAGGKFTSDTDTSAYFEMCADETHASIDKGNYFLFTNFEEIHPLPALHQKARNYDNNHLQIRIEDQWFECNCPSLDESEQNALATDKNIVVSCTPTGPRTLIWINEGGREQWRQDRAQKKIKNEQRKQAQRERAAAEAIKNRHDQGDHFINPYTFVPLPEQIRRSKPKGHEALKLDAVSGWFTWRLTFKTPLVYPVEDLPITKDGSIRYPGSALRGALRNLHESLTGSCLRILDDEYLPVHREPMSVGAQEHRLAVVREVNPVTGAITKVEPTEKLCWVESSVIHKVISADELYSGSRVNLNAKTRNYASHAKRYEITDEDAASAGDDWVLHLSEAGARPRPSKKHPTRSYFIAAGRLTGEKLITITQENWEQFKLMCAGSEDMTGEDNSNQSSPSSPRPGEWDCVKFQKSLGEEPECIGKRHKANALLSNGDTVWLDSNDRLKMATIWRYPGEYSVGDRMNKDFKPCHDPKSLCPSCAVFGSVDTRTPEKKKPSVEQAGYASHVRVGWAYSAGSISPDQIDIPPLRSPKPSSGGFYLEPGPSDSNKTSNDIPHAHWGSDSDKPKPRKIRGRKYYWHGQTDRDEPNRQTSRSKEASDGSIKIAREIVLETKVSFDNLTREQLGWLLAAADPGTFFNTTNTSQDKQQNEYWIHLGRSKPLGYGSAQPEITNLHVQTAHGRYDTVEDVPTTTEELISAISSHIPDELKCVHNYLRRVLMAHPQYVADDRIWYPPIGNFKKRNNREEKEEFDQSFQWFASNSGGRPPNGLTPLPDAMDDNQYLPTGASQKDSSNQKKNNTKGRRRR
ncbi:CRISPR-associated protein [Propionibacterium australiense]|nr:TIGR03986 family CRISPR-associated RAMP protein [Propionibacterium australiense]SYZ32981.1 CRISPR type III-associated RAMP protein [Propionibacterium australiense]VEH92307.1 CRISPR-associated protein [Propionibacterium australiense]